MGSQGDSLIKKKKPRQLTAKISPKIGPNDLKIKVGKIKSEVASKGVAKVVVEIPCQPSQLDQANALLLSVKKMLEGTLVATSKAEVKKRDENEEETETLSEQDVEEALENPADQRTEAPRDKSADGRPSPAQLFLRQEFLNQAAADQAPVPHKAAKNEQASEVPLKLSDEEIAGLVEKEFAKFSSKGLDMLAEISLKPDPQEQTKLERSFQVQQEDEEFLPDEEKKGGFRFTSAFVARTMAKVKRLQQMEQNPGISRAAANSQMKVKIPKVAKNMNADFEKSVTSTITSEWGLQLDVRLMKRTETISRNDPETRARIAHQNELIKRL